MDFATLDSPVRVGDLVDDKYVVESIIGVGGMGVVVGARHAELGQRVALKFMLPQVLGVPGAVDRFMREARSVVQLESQHVARVYDVGSLEGGTPYLVMELLEGCDLGTLVKKQGPLQVADAVEYVIQACEAVAEAHALGIIHRDLKPANLFLTRRRNGMPLVKVLDFGISKLTHLKATDPSLTKTSDVVGSPLYMAPEQVRSARDVDPRTDIWALGIILHELMAGEVPFHATNVPQLCALVLESEPLPLHRVRAEVPEALSAVVMTCLAKIPEERFASVQDLVRALAPFAAPGAPPRSVAAMLPQPELPAVPVRSSLTLGETLNRGTMSGLAGAPGETTPGNTDMSWVSRRGQRRSWLYWAVPVIAIAASVMLALATWFLLPADAESDAKPAASPALSAGDAVVAVEAGTQPGSMPAESASAPAPVGSREPPPAEAISTTKRTSPDTKRTSSPPAETAPVPTATGSPDDFLPTDRK